MLEHTIAVSIVGTILVFMLTPGLLVRIPKNGSLKTVAIVHALVFCVFFFLMQCVLEQFLDVKEGATSCPTCPGEKASKLVKKQLTNVQTGSSITGAAVGFSNNQTTKLTTGAH